MRLQNHLYDYIYIYVYIQPYIHLCSRIRKLLMRNRESQVCKFLEENESLKRQSEFLKHRVWRRRRHRNNRNWHNRLRAQHKARPDTPSLAPAAKAKSSKKKENNQLRNFLRVSGATKQMRKLRLSIQIPSSCQRTAVYVRCLHVL